MNKRFLLVFPLVALCGCMSSPVGTPAAPAVSSAQSAQVATPQTIDDVLNSAPLVSGPVRVVKGAARAIPATAATRSLKFLLNFVATGPDISGVPCLGCVNGTEGDTFGMSIPDNYVPTGASWDYIMSFTSITYAGTCKLSWAITSGKKVVDKFAFNEKISTPGSPYVYAIARSRPSYSGSAMLTGQLSCHGGGKAQETTAPMIFQ
jgi:hypothetical protein